MFIHFTKMQGLGNDFVVIDLITQFARLQYADFKRIADRNQGIGCDQILLIEPPLRGSAHFYLRIVNANGLEVEHCGNGVRCAARFFYEMGFTNSRTVQIDCLAGPLTAFIEADESITVNMGLPKFSPKDIPFTTADPEALLYPLNIENKTVVVSLVSMGNPHVIVQVPSIETAPVSTLGPLLSKHPSFPKEANVSFMQIVTRSHIRLRVFERGVGETHACGSGGCAAVCAGIRLGELDPVVRVSFLKGSLKISWQDPHAPLYMTGPARSVFVGRFRV